MSQRQKKMLPTIAPAGQREGQISAISNKGSKTGSLKNRKRAKPHLPFAALKNVFSFLFETSFLK